MLWCEKLAPFSLLYILYSIYYEWQRTIELIFVKAFLIHCDIEAFLAIRLKHETVDSVCRKHDFSFTQFLKKKVAFNLFVLFVPQ